jgi:SAM-dependent methyltransferase
MAQWDDGYVTDVAYTSNFYREITPSWIAMTSLLLGHRPPDLARPFSYADLGCGNGFTTLVVAACCPHADVWGFDFNPAHVEFANGLAARAGLGNVRFVESSFADLVTAPDGAMPDFDFMVSHGVLSWISPANRRSLVAAVAKRLKPGGLVYLSYNVTTGWTAMVPVRALMRMLTVASPERTDVAVPGVLDYVDRLREAGALFFQANPTLENRLVEIRRQDPRYIAHEFLNQDWEPLMFAEIAGEMLEAKCRYIGSATRSLPARDPARYRLRAGVSPRFVPEGGGAVAGRRAPGAAGYDDAGRAGPAGARGWGLVRHPDRHRDRPARGVPAAAGVAGGRAGQHPRDAPVRRLRRPPAGGAHAGVHAAGGRGVRAPDAAGRRHSGRARCGAAAESGDRAGQRERRRPAAPAIGSSIGADVLETLLVGELLAGKPADVGALAGELMAVLGRSGRSVQRDGKPVTDVDEARQIVTEVVAGMLERRVPLLRGLGVVGP